ncbi:MAG: hypothetical protein GYB25_07720, partial [Rhodobacteraceae bacterium]|nr:hypothetical protein [Paracoccaceae bacterium]
TDTKTAKKAQEIEIEFADGKVVLGEKSVAKKASSKPSKPPEQGSLF